jgi:hypothetical protein
MKTLSVAVELHKIEKAQKQFRKLDTLSENELHAEFWELQDWFDRVTIDMAEGFDGQVKMERQRNLSARHQELTGQGLV